MLKHYTKQAYLIVKYGKLLRYNMKLIIRVLIVLAVIAALGYIGHNDFELEQAQANYYGGIR